MLVVPLTASIWHFNTRLKKLLKKEWTKTSAGTNLDQNVAVENHEVGGHLIGDLDVVGLQLLEHAEQHVVGIAVVACHTKQ